jgi:hypothetical protein
MKSFCKLLAASVAVCFATVAAFAADASGTWKWTQQGRQGGQGFEVTLKLDVKDGTLSGTMLGGTFGQNTIPDTAIGDASIKGDTVSFTVTRMFGETKRVSKYEGKVEGDTIKGTQERQTRDGTMAKSDWVATRAK